MMISRLRKTLRERGELILFGERLTLQQFRHWKLDAMISAIGPEYQADGIEGRARLYLMLPGLMILLGTIKAPPTVNDGGDSNVRRWGLYFNLRNFIVCYLGHKRHYLNMPWQALACRHEILLNDKPDGGKPFSNFAPAPRFVPGVGTRPMPSNVYAFRAFYGYRLRSGRTQQVTATVTVERRRWCWRARPFRWLKWPGKTTTAIVVSFSEEVGEQAGSWKGGVVGCGWTMNRGEAPYDCLRRMERERVFR